MKVIVISTAPFIEKDGGYFTYSPYAKELELWAKHSGEIAMLCPVRKDDSSLLLSRISFTPSKIFEAKEFDVKSIAGLLRAIRYSILNFYLLFQAMRWADHIHLRCPGNISLMGCIVQIFFPRKIKTAKYAGNWDPDAKQPLAYRMQKWILANTFLTKNISVLVYGQWRKSTKNIKPFFTATYRETDKVSVIPRELSGTIKFVFVGTLSEGKRPLYAIQIIEKLKTSGFEVALDLYGDGAERNRLQQYISDNNLEGYVRLQGNQPEIIVRQAYCDSHFAILPSKSEGWPKVVAEAMFWGCLPIASKVSCVPYMLDDGNRGVLLEMNPESDVADILSLLKNPDGYKAKVAESIVWSRQFTLDLFEKEIKQLLQP